MKNLRRWLPLVLPLLAILVTVGTFHVQFTSRAEDGTELQACCFDNGGCEDLQYEACLEKGGTPQGEGTSCITMPSPCPQPTQACCFDDGTCKEVDPEACIAEGGTPQGEGTDCSPNPCKGEEEHEGPHPRPSTGASVPATIELISPASGAGFDPRFPDLQFCWKGIGNPGITYEVIHEGVICDPSVLEGPHPFAPLIPDPSLQARRRELVREKWAKTTALNDMTEYCEEISASFTELHKVRDSLEAEMREIQNSKQDAELAEVGDFSLYLPDSCPAALSSLLNPYPASFDDLSPCADCRAFADRLTGIIGRLQSLDAQRFVSTIEFYRLAGRWIGGADHRGTMQVYHAFYSTIDRVISFVTDLIDELTPDQTDLLEDIIERYMTEDVCRIHPTECQAIRDARDVKDQLETIRGIMKAAETSGTPGPGFMIQIVQAMAQAASAATAVAVEGWENYATVMQAALSNAYASLLCEKELLAWLLAQEEEIKGMCEACRGCISDEISAIDEEIAGIAAAEEEAAQARTSYWQQQRSLIATQIQQALALLGDDWHDNCCKGGAERIEVPGDSPCSERLEEALKETLGDKACFLTFVFTCNEDGLVSFEFSFPLATRRPGCCVPSRLQRTSLGQRQDPGKRGETVCYPRSDEEAARLAGKLAGLSSGGWLVEGRDRSGNLIAASERRDIGRSGETTPAQLPQTPPSPPACICSVSASLNGIPLPPGGATITLQAGTPTNIAVGGGCGPACDNGSESIRIQPPMAPMSSGSALFIVPALPLTIQGASTMYDFPNPGTYTVTVNRTCGDGASCSYAFNVEASSPRSPVSRRAREGETGGYCSCGSDECLELSYMGGEEPLIPILGHRLALTGPIELALQAESGCRPDCSDGRTVRWEITGPGGDLEVFEGEGLYRISYTFDLPGEYLLCLIEGVPCEDGESIFENWWIFEVEESD